MKNIWTNGCFDILHVGHIRLFEFAKSIGDALYVGLDDDLRVKLHKGEYRPINNQVIRKEMLMSIKFINKVSIFSYDEELEELIKKYNIDTIVVGDDYKNKKVIGSQLVRSVIFFPKINNISTTLLLKNI